MLFARQLYLKDVLVLTFLASGIWLKRDFARPTGQGVYELDINVPQTGVYLIFVESRSQGVAFRQQPYLILQVSDSTQPAATTNKATEVTKR